MPHQRNAPENAKIGNSKKRLKKKQIKVESENAFDEKNGSGAGRERHTASRLIDIAPASKKTRHETNRSKKSITFTETIQIDQCIEGFYVSIL